VKATFLQQCQVDGLTSVTLEHTDSGFQLQITQGPEGFVLHSSQGVIFERYSDLAWEVRPEREYDETAIQQNDTQG